MKFKVGDKVKLIGNVFWIDKDYTNKIGIIVEVSPNGCFEYIVGINTEKIPIDEFEIEKVFTKGRQLLFSFMTE